MRQAFPQKLEQILIYDSKNQNFIREFYSDNSMIKVVPLPGTPSLCTEISPPCAWINCFVIANPSPLWTRSLRDLSPRQKRSKMKGRSSDTMPVPVSLT